MNFDAKEALPGMRAECEAVLRRLPECLVIERALHACSEKIDALSAYTAISSGRVVGRTLLEKACSSVCTLTLLWKQGASWSHRPVDCSGSGRGNCKQRQGYEEDKQRNAFHQSTS
jgi:hypothetical protein